MEPAMKPTAFPFAAKPRPRSTRVQGDALPGPSPDADCTPRRPEVDAPAPNDVAIYELTTLVGGWPRWLCGEHLKTRAGQSPKRLHGAPVTDCDDCERNRQQQESQ